MYKDKSKQKAAQRERTRRYRAKQKGVTSKGVTQGVTLTERTVKDVTFQGVTLPTLNKDLIPQTALTTQNTDEQEPRQSTIRTATLQDYLDNPDDYIARREPERMNWGAWMNMDELKRAGFKCNRVAIPGDWDYYEIDEEWMNASLGTPKPTPAAPVDESKKRPYDPLGRIHKAEEVTA